MKNHNLKMVKEALKKCFRNPTINIKIGRHNPNPSKKWLHYHKLEVEINAKWDPNKREAIMYLKHCFLKE